MTSVFMRIEVFDYFIRPIFYRDKRFFITNRLLGGQTILDECIDLKSTVEVGAACRSLDS